MGVDCPYYVSEHPTAAPAITAKTIEVKSGTWTLSGNPMAMYAESIVIPDTHEIRIGPFHLKNVGTAKTTAAPYRAAAVFPIPYAAFQYHKDGCPIIVVF